MHEKNDKHKIIKYNPFPFTHSNALIPIIPNRVVAILPHSEKIPKAWLLIKVS
jgi:hypothetical protein